MFALPKQEKYPLDSMGDIQRAQDYFITYERDFPLEDRREFCLNLAKRQGEVGIKPHEKVASYAGNKIDQNKLKLGVLAREALLEKNADVRTHFFSVFRGMSQVDDMLKEFITFDRKNKLDRLWDKDMPNPVEGLMEPLEGPTKPIMYGKGPELATEDQIRKLSNHADRLKEYFSDDFVRKFAKDGVKAIESLSDEDQIILLRMARLEEANEGYYDG